MLRFNAKLIENPRQAREALMGVTAALYTGSIKKDTPIQQASEIAGICAAMWQVCDALETLERSVQQ